MSKIIEPYAPSLQIEPHEEIVYYWDDVDAVESPNGYLEFFTGSADPGRARRHGANKLPGNRPHTAVGIGLCVQSPFIVSGAGIDPADILSVFRDGTLEIRTHSGTETTLDVLASSVMPSGQRFDSINRYAAGEEVDASSINTLWMPGGDFTLLDKPFIIPANDPVSAKLHVATGGLPTAAEWAAANQPTLSVRLVLQCVARKVMAA